MAAGTLGHGERRRLVEALLRIDALSVRGAREACVAELQKNLSRPLIWERHERMLHDVWQLAVSCLERPGGIHTLLDVLEFFDRGSHAFAEARLLVDTLLPEPLLTTEERLLLGQLVRHLEVAGLSLIEHAELVPAYQRAVGEFGPPPRQDAYDERRIVDVRLLVEQLEEAPLREDGVVPLLHFVGELAGYSKGPVATAFTEWMERFANRCGLTPDWRRLLPPTGEKPALETTKRAASLVFECRPDGADPGRLAIKVRLEAADGQARLVYCDERPESVERMPALVESLLKQQRGLVALEYGELTIEFVLPRELLGLPCDQFVINLGGVPRRLGIEYPVVLRSLDRMEETWLWPKWQRKWSRLREGPEAGAVVHPLCRPGEYDGERLFTVLSAPEAVGVAMGYPPADVEQVETAQVDEIRVALETGVPIVVWSRKYRPPELFAEEARKLCGTDPETLPLTVRMLRRKAVLAQDMRRQTLPQGGGLVDEKEMDESEHLGMHLALLYDDADRVPEPYDPLRPPA